MKLGVFTVLFADRPLEAALDRIVEAGLECVEIGTGNYPGDAHCKPADLLGEDAALGRFQRAIASRGLEISALSCHGNPLHPRPEVARASHETFVRTVQLAARLGVGRVNVFSGCPGAGGAACGKRGGLRSTLERSLRGPRPWCPAAARGAASLRPAGSRAADVRRGRR